MHDPTLALLQQQISRLECQMRWWKTTFALSLFVLFSGTLLGLMPAQNKVVEAERLIIKDPEGKIRLILGDWGYERRAPLPEEERYDTVLTGTVGNWKQRAWGLHVFGASGRYLAGLRPLGGPDGDRGCLTLRDKETVSRIDLLVGSAYADLHLKASSVGYAQDREESTQIAEALSGAQTTHELEQVFALKTAADREGRFVMTQDQGSLTLSEKGVTRLTMGQARLQKEGIGESLPSQASLIVYDQYGKTVRTLP